jgi:hypothetical protein
MRVIIGDHLFYVHVVLFVSWGQWKVLQVVFTKCIVVFQFSTDGSDLTL